jgi:threonine aldolase
MFYTFIGSGGSRLMCSWDTTERDIRSFIGDIKNLLKKKTTRPAGPKKGRSFYH